MLFVGWLNEKVCVFFLPILNRWSLNSWKPEASLHQKMIEFSFFLFRSKIRKTQSNWCRDISQGFISILKNMHLLWIKKFSFDSIFVFQNWLAKNSLLFCFKIAKSIQPKIQLFSGNFFPKKKHSANDKQRTTTERNAWKKCHRFFLRKLYNNEQPETNRTSYHHHPEPNQISQTRKK